MLNLYYEAMSRILPEKTEPGTYGTGTERREHLYAFHHGW